MVVAVKVLDLQQAGAGASKTSLSECETLWSARPRNLIGILTCCASVDAAGSEFMAFPFDFMPTPASTGGCTRGLRTCASASMAA